MMERTQQVAVNANFFNVGRIGPRLRRDDLVQHQRVEVRRIRIDFDLRDRAVEISHALGMILKIGILIENRLRAVMSRSNVRQLIREAVGRIVDASGLIGCKILHVDAKERFRIEPVRAGARLGRWRVLLIAALEENV